MYLKTPLTAFVKATWPQSYRFYYFCLKTSGATVGAPSLFHYLSYTCLLENNTDLITYFENFLHCEEEFRDYGLHYHILLHLFWRFLLISVLTNINVVLRTFKASTVISNKVKPMTDFYTDKYKTGASSWSFRLCRENEVYTL